MNRIGTKLFWAVVALGVAGGIVYAFIPRPVQVDMAEVKRGPMQLTVNEDGKTRIKERYVVSAPLSGQLQRIRLNAGDQVTAGVTLLAVIEPTDPELLDARALAAAEARVKASESSLDRAGPTVRRTQTALEFAEKMLGRVRKSFELSAVSREQLDTAEFLFRSRAEEAKSARFAEEIARFELELARAALIRSRPAEDGADDPQNVRITSPIHGHVLKVIQKSEAIVVAGTPLLELGNHTDLEIEIDVLSRDAVRIRRGADVILQQWGGEETLRGIVRLVEPSAFTKVSTLGVEEQRVNVIIDLVDTPERRPKLGDAYRVEARIVTWQADDVLQVPVGALFRRGEARMVFVVERGRAVIRRIKIGHRNDQHAEVLEGLKPGESVIVYPGDRVSDEKKVAPRESDKK